MSSNHPHGGPQPPMPGPGANPGSHPGQPPSPYGYPRQPSPGGPPTASGYSFGPFAPDEQGTEWQGGPQYDPYGASPAPHGPGPARRAQLPKRNRKMLIIVGAASLAVILMAVFAIVVATRGGPAANPGSSAQGQQTNPAQSGAAHNTPRPSDAVSAYLQALAAGDAVAALSYAADPVPTGVLLTNEVLAKSQNRAALTEIQVPVVEDQNATSVSATYTLGSSAVSESFDVVKVADAWKISRAVKDLDLSFIVDGSVPVKINGVKVDQRSVSVLPGSYAFTTGLPYIGYGSKNVVLVKSPYVEADTSRIQSQLTNSGEKAVISATEKSFNKCLKAHSLTPKNCPMKLDSKYSYTKNTITWRQTGSDPFRKPKITLTATQARIEIPLSLKLSGSCTYKGRSGNCSATLTGKSVAVVKVTTKPLKVNWLRPTGR
jgi:hypothetical protein